MALSQCFPDFTLNLSTVAKADFFCSAKRPIWTSRKRRRHLGEEPAFVVMARAVSSEGLCFAQSLHLPALLGAGHGKLLC